LLQLNKIYNQNCKEGMKLLPDNSISSIVTDPPYGLSKEPNIVEVLTNWLNNEEYIHNSKGFMNKDWDSFVPNPSIWKEAYRVLKPGGYLLCFAGTRTYDLMCISLRLAGFEIRDQIDWIFSQGFPKSMDISKQIDKKFSAEREIIGEGKYFNRQPNGLVSCNVTGFSSEIGKRHGSNGYITEPSTDEAKQWSGYGTNLKPAHEPIIVSRKPLSEKTIVDNVLKWNTGGINIDDCRIEYIKNDDPRIGKNYQHNAKAGLEIGNNKDNSSGEKQQLHNNQGRFPANIIMDEDAGKILDLQSGITKSGKVKENKDAYEGKSNTGFLRGKSTLQNQHGDTGGGSRFFKQCNYDDSDYEVINFMYCAKASKKERGEGNNHPTVKPLSLIKYLITLVTPPNGICLDPFEGSGTHAVSCEELGFDYIGFEMNKDYCDIAEKRLNNLLNNKNI